MCTMPGAISFALPCLYASALRTMPSASTAIATETTSAYGFSVSPGMLILLLVLAAVLVVTFL